MKTRPLLDKKREEKCRYSFLGPWAPQLGLFHLPPEFDGDQVYGRAPLS